MTSAPHTARARAREELTVAIKDAARRQLAEQGAAALSLRSVARELGMVSSAVYRYFPSRDDLLTALIIDAYDALADAAEQREAQVDRHDHAGRWAAVAEGLRDWALAHRHEWALVFGSPVPGYAAPQTTVDPAARVPLLLSGIVREAGAVLPPDAREVVPPPVAAELTALGDLLGLDAPPALLARLLLAWTTLLGAISVELFGHLVGAVSDHEPYFRFQVQRLGEQVGLRT